MIIKPILENDMDRALKLIWEVFLEFEAPDYSPDGVAIFKDSIDNRNWVNQRDFYGAYTDDNQLLGVIATKDLSHIALFFVDSKYHKQGIGKELYKKVELLNDKDYMTVNSSPYAHEVYKHLGFVDTDKEKNLFGLRFIPMKKTLKK